MQQMVATKRVKYPHGPDGREYAPGEAFTALSDRDAKALYIAGKARYGATANATDLPKRYDPVDPRKASIDDTVTPNKSLTDLRDDYHLLTGKRPFNGWDADTLREKMGEYRRRDMRAQE